jgi:hypothetical protein
VKWFFNIFSVWEIGKTTDISPFCLCQRTFEGSCVYIYLSIYLSYICFFFETMIHCFSIQNWEISILNGDFSIQTFLEAFRFEPFFSYLSIFFFQGIFSIRNGEISIQNGDFSIQTFSDAIWTFF